MNDNGFKLAKERSRRYPAQTITDADYIDDTALLANIPIQAETLLHSLERATRFNQRGDISTLNGSSLKQVDKFTYLWMQCVINRKRLQDVTSEGMVH